MAWAHPSRLAVVAGGVGLIVVCVVIALGGTWWLFFTWPNLGPRNGRVAVIFPGVPLTILATGVVGTWWASKHQASATETVAVLFLMQLIVIGFLFAVGARDYDSISMFLVLANLLFAPWWFLGHVIAVVRDPRNPAKSSILHVDSHD